MFLLIYDFWVMFQYLPLLVFPEVCLAWLRSQDTYYNSGAFWGSSNSTYRIIHINCPVDVDVYDSSNNLVASFADDVPQDIDSGIIFYINENGEKMIYLPADDEYNIDIEATNNGDMTYSINELNLVSGNIERVVNYYEVPLTNGETFTGIVPAFTSNEIENNASGGSLAAYKLLNKSNAEIPASEDIKGTSVESVFYNVIVEANNDSGHVQGSGSFLKGAYAKVKAIPQMGSSLLGWFKNGQLVSTDLEYRFAVTENTILTAEFVAVELHDLKLVAGVGGKITSVEGKYSAGTEIAVVAEADTGFNFKEWTAIQGSFDSATNSYAWFTMPNSSVTLTAIFESLEPMIDPKPDPEPEVSPKPEPTPNSTPTPDLTPTPAQTTTTEPANEPTPETKPTREQDSNPDPEPINTNTALPVINPEKDIKIAINTANNPFAIGGIVLPDNCIVIYSDIISGKFADAKITVTAEQLKESGLDVSKVKLWHIDDNNKITELKNIITRNEDGSVTIIINHFSYYVLSETAPKNAVSNEKNPPTAVVIGFVPVMIIGGIALFSRKRKGKID